MLLNIWIFFAKSRSSLSTRFASSAVSRRDYLDARREGEKKKKSVQLWSFFGCHLYICGGTKWISLSACCHRLKSSRDPRGVRRDPRVCGRACVRYHFHLTTGINGHHPRAGWMCSACVCVWSGGGQEICNFKHGCVYKNARGYQLGPYVGAVQAVWKHLFMVTGSPVCPERTTLIFWKSSA